MPTELTSILPAGAGVTAAAMPLFGMDTAALTSLIAGLQQPAYRGRQLAEAMYRNRARTLGEISTLPEGLRQQLRSAGYEVGLPELAQTFYSVDGTERYLVRMADGQTVESVWMPNGDGAADELFEETISSKKPRTVSTLCISSQVGCAVNCQFCFTAKLGIKRNLTAGEIAGQVVSILNRHDVLLAHTKQGQRNGEDPARINLVFMGQGEPFLNYDNFMAAFRLLLNEIGIPAPRMTVSTSGIVPAIERFALEPVRPRLAISLNGPNDALREQVMPLNRKWNIAALMAAIAKIPFKAREFVMFEYVLLGGVNDRLRDAIEVSRLIRSTGLPAKVNLIAWNSGPGIAYATPNAEDVAAFQNHLVGQGIRTYIRRPRGLDIYAACGQLKTTEG